MALSITPDHANLLELTRTLTAIQRQLLLKLSQKGASLLLELAMSIFQFPEAIGEPMQQLQAANLVTTSSVEGGSFGPELFDLSERGRQVVRLLRDPALQAEIAYAPPSALAQSDLPSSRRDEVALLTKLGNLAEKQGDAQSAADYYRQALEITQRRSN
jgi:hypothetical protein